MRLRLTRRTQEPQIIIPDVPGEDPTITRALDTPDDWHPGAWLYGDQGQYWMTDATFRAARLTDRLRITEAGHASARGFLDGRTEYLFVWAASGTEGATEYRI